VFGHEKHPELAIKVGTADEWCGYVLWGKQHGYAGNCSPLIHSIKSFGVYNNYYERIEPIFIAVMERLAFRANAGTDEQYRKFNQLKGVIENGYGPSSLLSDDEYFFAKHCHKFGWTGDVWEKNVMYRANGDIVLTDPQYFGKDDAIKTSYRTSKYHLSPKSGIVSQSSFPKVPEPTVQMLVDELKAVAAHSSPTSLPF
jgi:hypothetical protein